MRPASLALLLAPLALAACGMPMENIAAENRAVHWSGNVSSCDAPSALGKVTGRFAHLQAGLAGKGLSIVEITQIRQTGFRKNGPSHIPKRDCVASALLSDNTRQPVYYSILAGVGAYSIYSERVESCVAGHDPYHLGEAACSRMSR